MKEKEVWVRIGPTVFLATVNNGHASAVQAARRLIETGAEEDEILEELLRVELISGLILHAKIPDQIKPRGRELHAELIAMTPGDLVEQVKGSKMLTAMLRAIPDAMRGMCE